METCKNNDFFYNDNCSVRTVNRKAAVRTTYHVPHTGLSTLYTHTLFTSCTQLTVQAFYRRTKADKSNCQRHASKQGEAEFKLCS